MSKGGLIFFLLLAIGSGFIATAAVRNYMANAVAAVEPVKMVTEPVVVAKFKVLAGTSLNEENLKITQFPKGTAPENVYTKIEDLDGRVVNSNLYPGEIVLPYRLEGEGAMAGLTAIIPKGLRAITLRVDDQSSVAGFVRPNNYVDVIITLNTPETGSDTISKVILQNVKILATGQQIETDPENEKGKRVVPTVTVLATLEQCERISLASTTGRVRLVLRNYGDQAEVETGGARLSSLLPESEADMSPPKEVIIEVTPTPAPAAAPAPPQDRFRTVKLHSGDNTREIHFSY
ncbi:MAG: Flp pilus assembly protein CpaB [Candidatus Omnitrophica bacterium]|nr:Flp pilus assembly protein CpaB [Candidatus Omnitrophota bacterium]